MSDDRYTDGRRDDPYRRIESRPAQRNPQDNHPHQHDRPHNPVDRASDSTRYNHRDEYPYRDSGDRPVRRSDQYSPQPRDYSRENYGRSSGRNLDHTPGHGSGSNSSDRPYRAERTHERYHPGERSDRKARYNYPQQADRERISHQQRDYGRVDPSFGDTPNNDSNYSRTQTHYSDDPHSDDPHSPGYRLSNNDHGEYNRHPDNRSIDYPVQFHGKTGEYFKIWIVNIFLTIITLYIYSAWAKVRTKRYFYGNTTVDGSSFEYHATGRQLVVGRLVAVVLLIIYSVFQEINTTVSLTALGLLAIAFPWALWRSLKFNAKASSYRNIRFQFDGGASTPYWIILFVPLAAVVLISAAVYLLYFQTDLSSTETLIDKAIQFLTQYGDLILGALIFTVYGLIPLLHSKIVSFSHNNHRYGTAKFSAPIKTRNFYGYYIAAFFIMVFAFVAFAGLVYVASRALGVDPALLLTENDPSSWKGVAIIYLIVIPVSSVAVAYFRSAIRNHRYNTTTIGTRVNLRSTVRTWSLWWLNISNLAIIIGTLGFGYPYTRIRSARYFAKRTSLSVMGDLDSFTQQEKTKLRAMGEEVADAFDVEFDIGI